MLMFLKEQGIAAWPAPCGSPAHDSWTLQGLKSKGTALSRANPGKLISFYGKVTGFVIKGEAVGVLHLGY